VTQLESEHEVRIRAYPMGLSQSQAAHALWSELTNAGVAVDVLVNKAGVGLYGELWEQDTDELRHVGLERAVLTLLTRYALPGMVERGWGRILNLASLVAYQPEGPEWPLITPQSHTSCRFRKAWRLSCAEPG
jgi:uncharacterized protein